MSRILITGATGFIGSFIAEEALERGMEVWVALRESSSLKYVNDKRLHLLYIDLSSEDEIAERFRGLSFDFVVHAAGVTKCLDKRDFYRVNTEGTKNLVNAILRSGMPVRRFVYLSSLSVFGPARERYPYREITSSDTPQPNTEYGKSKLLAERFLDETARNNPSFSYVVLRPTGVYGPRERDYFMMAKSIKQHVDFAVGYKPQDITFVYVLDVVQAVFLALENGASGGCYFLSDGEVYRSSAFSDLIRSSLGSPWLIRIKAPIWLLRIITMCGEWAGRLTGRISALNNDKYHILRQRNWRCDIQPAMDELGYTPRYKLDEGVRLTISWYKANGWL